MIEDNKLLLLAIQQTLDENSELLKKIQNTPKGKKSVENIKLDIKPLSEILNNQNSNITLLLKRHFANFSKLSDNKPASTTVTKNFSVIGISSDSSISIIAVIRLVVVVLFLFFTTWLGLFYWFNQGYKIEDQFSAYKTIQVIKYIPGETFSKKEILNLYHNFQKNDSLQNVYFDKIELEIIKNRKIEAAELELQNLKGKPK